MDRKKELIIRSGYNVYPREVEEVLSSCPGVLEAAVVGVPDDDHGEEVVALVVPAQQGGLDPEAVKAFARERLAAYKYPRHVLVVTELPKGPTGKISKRDIDRRRPPRAALRDTAAPPVAARCAAARRFLNWFFGSPRLRSESGPCKAEVMRHA